MATAATPRPLGTPRPPGTTRPLGTTRLVLLGKQKSRAIQERAGTAVAAKVGVNWDRSSQRLLLLNERQRTTVLPRQIS
ncbi:MAG: hypothetical protein ACK557_12800, partial [Planctomycetota bacterium]